MGNVCLCMCAAAKPIAICHHCNSRSKMNEVGLRPFNKGVKLAIPRHIVCIATGEPLSRSSLG